MEKLLELLKKNCPTVDFENSQNLISEKVIDSMDLLAIISDIEEEFGISIELDRIDPENFDSATAMWKMITEIKS